MIRGGGRERGRVDNRRPLWDETRNPAEQFDGVGRHAGRGREGPGILGRNPIDDGQPYGEIRTVADIGLAADRRGEDDAAFLLQFDEAVAAGGVVRSEIVAGDGDETPAVGQTCKGGADMADGGLGKAHADRRRGRKGRVHQHHARPDRWIEPIVDLLSVVSVNHDIAEQPAEQLGAGLGDLVQGEPCFRQLGENRQQAGAGRGLKHKVGRCQGGCFGGDKAERDRCRELLQMLRFLRAAGLGRQPRG